MPNQLKTPKEVDISIIGGGMVGATLALLLSSCKCGWKIQIIDSQSFENLSVSSTKKCFDVRSTALSQSSCEIFETLGIWEALSSNVSPISKVDISDKGYLGSAKLLAEEHNLPALGYVVENQRMGSALFEAINETDDIEIIDSAKIEQLSPVAGGMELCFSTKLQPDKTRAINTKLLVIADGARSAARSLLGVGVTTKNYDQVAIVANILLSQDHNNVAYERFTDSGPLAMLPLNKIDDAHRSSLVWTVSLAQAEKLLSLPENEFLAELQSCFGFRLGKFTGVGLRNSFPVQLITSDEQVRSNLVLVGNAAHSLHPVAGQGFNLALRDIAVLANQLAKSAIDNQALGEYRVLEGYLKHQKSDQERTILLSDFLPTIFGSTAIPAKMIRNTGLFALDIIPLFRTNFAKLGMGLQTRSLKLSSARLSNSRTSDTE